MFKATCQTRLASSNKVEAMSEPHSDMTNVKQELDEASKLFALKKYESAANLFASALESLYV